MAICIRQSGGQIKFQLHANVFKTRDWLLKVNLVEVSYKMSHNLHISHREHAPQYRSAFCKTHKTIADPQGAYLHQLMTFSHMNRCLMLLPDWWSPQPPAAPDSTLLLLLPQRVLCRIHLLGCVSIGDKLRSPLSASLGSNHGALHGRILPL
jgi:hypothetical protein